LYYNIKYNTLLHCVAIQYFIQNIKKLACYLNEIILYLFIQDLYKNRFDFSLQTSVHSVDEWTTPTIVELLQRECLITHQDAGYGWLHSPTRTDHGGRYWYSRNSNHT